MARIAALFPGQGSQRVGMGHDLADRWSAAAAVFSEIDRGLELDLSGLCWRGPEEELRLTTNTQPALLAHSVAAWRVLSEHGLRVDAVAGHSLGEYSAVVAAGGLDAVDAARTVRERGRLMQQAVPVGEGAMAAILGLDDDVVVAVCDEIADATGEAVVPANFNSPGQVVIAGAAAAVARAMEVLKERGARKAVPLPVSAPFHSPLMAPAREALEPTLRGLAFTELVGSGLSQHRRDSGEFARCGLRRPHPPGRCSGSLDANDRTHARRRIRHLCRDRRRQCALRIGQDASTARRSVIRPEPSRPSKRSSQTSSAEFHQRR